jgi:pimeloyl-ACP methyl ester carboxylesterase
MDGTADADRTSVGTWEKFTLTLEPEVGEDYLDYGLHWVSTTDNGVQIQSKAVEQDGAVISQSSADYYDDSKPTVIYFHGWQSGSSEYNYRRENFTFADNGDSNSMASWKNRGWNVGVFYWNQFADEDEVKDAEAKIWSANGPKGMRYFLNDGSSSTGLSPNKSVGELASEQISAALANNTSGNIRFAGHSLGNQLAVYAADLINDAVNTGSVSENVMPNRIALLDPFWSQDSKSYLGDANGDGSNDWVGEKTRWAITDMINDRDVAIEWYKSSAIFDLWIGDQNTALEKIVNLNSLRFWYLDATDITGKHVNARHWYFQSMNNAEPEEVTINWWGSRNETGSDAASARTSDNRIRAMMGDDHEWDQVEGRYTAKPSDDQFEIKDY